MCWFRVPGTLSLLRVPPPRRRAAAVEAEMRAAGAAPCEACFAREAF